MTKVVRKKKWVTAKAQLTAAPFTTYGIEFYLDSATHTETLPDGVTPFLVGQGSVYLGTVTVTTNKKGIAKAKLKLPACDVPPGTHMTSTATNLTAGTGDTSELSEAMEIDTRWPDIEDPDDD